MVEYKLNFFESIKRWDEAIPLGNGRIGSLIWGEPSALRFSLDRTDIWDLSTPINTDREDFTYHHLVSLAREEKTKEIRELFDAPYNYPTPTKLPAGKMIFHFQGIEEMTSELDLATAEARLELNGESGTIKMYSICHAESKTGMIRIIGNAELFSIELCNSKFGNEKENEEINYNPEEREISQGGLERLHYPMAIYEKEEGTPSFFWFIQKVDDLFSYGIVVGML
ncbi:MAG: glycoside hydrolase N-terminal domain-containing protein, partial [Bacillota bacterium]|nr:glycoside hydrolase N-terminal domain-containing protein [Bacillota bacterium]